MKMLFKIHLANRKFGETNLEGTEAFKDIIDSLFSIYSPLLTKLTVPSSKEQGENSNKNKPMNWADMLFLSEVQKQQKKKDELKRQKKKDKRRKDRTGQDRKGQDKTTGRDRTGQDEKGQDRTEQGRTERESTRQDELLLSSSFAQVAADHSARRPPDDGRRRRPNP